MESPVLNVLPCRIRMDYAAELRKIYEKHNRAKVKDIPVILKAYRGREHVLLVQLRKKYGAQINWSTKSSSSRSSRSRYRGSSNYSSSSRRRMRYGKGVKIPHRSADEGISYTFAAPVRMKELDTRLVESGNPSLDPQSVPAPSQSSVGLCSLCACIPGNRTLHVTICGFSRTTRKLLLHRANGQDCQVATTFDRTPSRKIAAAAASAPSIASPVKSVDAEIGTVKPPTALVVPGPGAAGSGFEMTVRGNSADALMWRGCTFEFALGPGAMRLPSRLRMAVSFNTLGAERSHFVGTAFLPVAHAFGKKHRLGAMFMEWHRLLEVSTGSGSSNSRGSKSTSSLGAVKVSMQLR